MGQFFTLAPVPAGFRCGRSDYGATEVMLPRDPATLIPLLEFSRILRSFPATLSLSAFSIRKAEGKGGLRNGR